MYKHILVACSLAIVQGCAAYAELARDPRDAPWDPPPGRQMFEQIPAWDDAARRICGGHLHPDEARRRGMSQRC